MTTYIVLLRALNVGGTGLLPMAELRRICAVAGFGVVKTYIASGNVVLNSPFPEKKVKAVLETCLESETGTRISVLVRTKDELAAVLRSNPYPKAPPNRTVAIFLDKPPAANALTLAKGQRDEEMSLGKREIYVYYPTDMGGSRLKIPEASAGTARNMNTVARLIELATSSAG